LALSKSYNWMKRNKTIFFKNPSVRRPFKLERGCVAL
jgi:hypothetical protein